MKRKEHKISFCITCMNRRHHLEATLLKNIVENKDYPNLEFVLLDYNSQDGLEDWAKQTLTPYIHSGKLVYYKTYDPVFFNHSHAKNMALRLGSGDIVCSINADHYIGQRFANFVNAVFNSSPKKVITPIPKAYYQLKKTHPPSGSWGKVCVNKDDFIAIRGYDEKMIKYGNDDIDLINRLELYGVKRYNIKKAEYCSVISHDNEERYSSKERLNNVFKVYIKYLSPNRSEIIFLFKNKKYERFVLKDEAESGAHNYQTTYLQKKYHYRYTIEDFLWEEGRWEQANSIILLTYGAGFDQKLVSTKSIKESEFYELSNTSLIDELSTFNYTQYNLNMMRKNLNDKKIQVNESNAFGSGVVYKNFDRKIGIEL